MKLSILTTTAIVAAALCGGPVLAQTATPPVTMQPVPNPPEAAPKMHAHKAKHHHKKAPAKPAADAAAPAQ